MKTTELNDIEYGVKSQQVKTIMVNCIYVREKSLKSLFMHRRNIDKPDMHETKM